jgi:hypothetical protein
VSRFHDEMPLGEARDVLRMMVKEGTRCPLCTQHAQVYPWKLYSTAAYALILFYKLGAADRFVHSRELKDRYAHKGQGDASRLNHWKLVVQESERRPDGGRSGWWMLTEHGVRFALGQDTIPTHAHVYDGRCLKLEGEPVTIEQALGKKFNYRELMAGV